MAQKMLDPAFGFIGEFGVGAAEVTSDLSFQATPIGLFNTSCHVVQEISDSLFDGCDCVQNDRGL